MKMLVPPSKFGDLQPTNTVNNAEPISIRHYQLKIDVVNKDVRFDLVEIKVSTPMPDINVYVARAAGRLDPQTPVGSTPSQYDMAVREPCYVVVELDPDRTNWQFENGIAALTTKDDPTEDNWGLIHAYANGKHSAGKATRDGCRVIYFGVAQRTGWQSSFVNLHTEFLQASTRLKVIIDPDVPNEGPDIFP